MDAVPYDVEVHPGTGVTNGKLGIWLFLASEVMLFGGLFSAYVLLRTAHPDWASEVYGTEALQFPKLRVDLAALNTLILITSSVTMVMAWASLKLNNFGRYKVYMLATILLSLGFMVVKYIEYTGKFHHGIYPKSSVFFAIYFTITGLHGLHVVGGVIVNSYFLGPGSKMWHTNPDLLAGRVECAGLYWHFVDLVWIFLFPILYLLQPASPFTP